MLYSSLMNGPGQTLYSILRISPDADIGVVKSAFRELAKQYHPDRSGGDTSDTEVFRLIEHAYRVLSDDNSRADYDRYLKSIRKREATAPRAPVSADDLKSQLNYILWEVEDIILTLKKEGTDRVVSGKTLRLWLLEILVFIDQWILDPAGFRNFFYEARLIPDEKPYNTVTRQGSPENFLPYVNIEDFFYDVRMRMNRFIDKTRPGDLSVPVNGSSVTFTDAIIEALLVSYHYLGSVNDVLGGSGKTVSKFIHTHPVFERQGVILLPRAADSK